jgi:hypothetical protein
MVDVLRRCQKEIGEFPEKAPHSGEQSKDSLCQRGYNFHRHRNSTISQSRVVKLASVMGLYRFGIFLLSEKATDLPFATDVPGWHGILNVKFLLREG